MYSDKSALLASAAFGYVLVAVLIIYYLTV